MCLCLNITHAMVADHLLPSDLSPGCRLSDLEASGLLDQCIRPLGPVVAQLEDPADPEKNGNCNMCIA